MKQLSLSERLNQFATDQDDLSRRGEKNLAAETAQAIDSLTAERDQLAGKLAKLNHLAMIFVEDSEEIAEFFEASGGRNHLVLAKDVRELADEMADLLNEQTAKDGE